MEVLRLSTYCSCSHVLLQDIGHFDGAISLLVVFQNGGHCSAYCEARAVEGVDVLSAFFASFFESDIGPTTLKVTTIGAARNFSIFASGWEPYF